MNSTNIELNTSQISIAPQPSIPIEVLENSLKWQAFTILGCAISFFFFACFMAAVGVCPSMAIVSVVPLILYDLVKAVYCARKVYEGNDPDIKEFIKDEIECGFMIVYKIGIIVKIALPNVDCLYLVAPPMLIVITRVVLSMGVCQEIKDLYSIVFC